MGAVGKSVVGMRRNNNEDAIYVSEKGNPGIYIVADGMGGCNAGEIASKNAIEAFLDYTKGVCLKTEPLDMLVGGIVACNAKVYKKSLESEDLAEMGTTIVAAVVQDGRLYVAHVGDSRGYVFQNGKLTQLTADHSYVMELVRLGNLTMEQAAVHPKRHIITRAIGTRDTVDVDTVISSLNKGDIALLCSDGLSNMLTNEEISDILALQIDLDQKLEQLVDLANKNGGNDNISAVLIEE